MYFSETFNTESLRHNSNLEEVLEQVGIGDMDGILDMGDLNFESEVQMEVKTEALELGMYC